MNLEEKRKEIRELCQNLDESKITNVYISCGKEDTVRIEMHSLFKVFFLYHEKDYDKLIELLKEGQKEPELYTFDEIIRTIDNASVMYSNNDNYIDWLKEFIKSNIVPYQKLD